MHYEQQQEHSKENIPHYSFEKLLFLWGCVKSKLHYPFTVGAGSKPAQMIALCIRVGLEPTPTVTDCYMM